MGEHEICIMLNIASNTDLKVAPELIQEHLAVTNFPS